MLALHKGWKGSTKQAGDVSSIAISCDPANGRTLPHLLEPLTMAVGDENRRRLCRCCRRVVFLDVDNLGGGSDHTHWM